MREGAKVCGSQLTESDRQQKLTESGYCNGTILVKEDFNNRRS